jgi:nucleotidyltransferase/DNA polymerase involved in DNA repair
MGPGFVQDLPVGKFHGIGPATSAKMNGLGIFTGMDMRNQTLEFMTANFGKAGTFSTGSRSASTIDRSAPTGSESLSAPRTRSRRTSRTTKLWPPCHIQIQQPAREADAATSDASCRGQDTHDRQ